MNSYEPALLNGRALANLGVFLCGVSQTLLAGFFYALNLSYHPNDWNIIGLVYILFSVFLMISSLFLFSRWQNTVSFCNTLLSAIAIGFCVYMLIQNRSFDSESLIILVPHFYVLIYGFYHFMTIRNTRLAPKVNDTLEEMT
jgi:phosphatidylglycerophosphatase A